MHILLCLWGTTGLISGHHRFSLFSVLHNPLFFATLLSSFITAAKGIASFLLIGPCALVPKKGLFGGMGTMGFIFLFFNIASTLLIKSSMLAISFYDNLVVFEWVNTANDSKYTTIQTIHYGTIYHFQASFVIYWSCFNLLPQLILVSFSTF